MQISSTSLQTDDQSQHLITQISYRLDAILTRKHTSAVLPLYSHACSVVKCPYHLERICCITMQLYRLILVSHSQLITDTLTSLIHLINTHASGS